MTQTIGISEELTRPEVAEVLYDAYRLEAADA